MREQLTEDTRRARLNAQPAGCRAVVEDTTRLAPKIAFPRLWALARYASERDRVRVTEPDLTMTKGVFALVALCSFAFGFVGVWYFLG